MSKITDKYGDTLEITAEAEDGSFDIECREDDQRTLICITSEQGLQLAKILAPGTYVARVENDPNTALLTVAKQHGLTASFRYQKKSSGNIEARRVVPEEFIKDGTIVVGYDPDREEYRTFRLDRIIGAVSV